MARPGASTFTIEGRAAPALFVVGWLASLMGLGAILVAVMAGGGTTSVILVGVGLSLVSVGLIAAAGSQGLERRARGAAPYQGPSPFLLFAAAFAVASLAGLFVGGAMLALGVPVDSPLANLTSIAMLAIVYVGLIRLLVVDTGALSWAEMGVHLPDRTTLSEIGTGALWAIPVIAATVPVAIVLQALFAVTPKSPLPASGETTGFILNLIAGAIIAPFAEELLFRGLSTTAWVRGLGVRRGIVRGALFFAAVHILNVSGDNAGEAIQLAVIGFATRVPVALALGYLFVRRGSIWVPFGLHAAFNGILLVLAEVAARAV